MSKRITAMMAVALLVAACDGNPFLVEDDEPTGPVEPLPGTEDPTASDAIDRYEALDEDSGSGYAENITFDSSTNTFSVDNLGFDGANAYSQTGPVTTLGPYAVYEAAPFVNDPLTGNPIQQFDHRLLAGVSTSGRTEFAIVRTGEYIGYGFGGFVMRRDNTGVVLPTTGQAQYTGTYAGIQDFDGRPGMRYTTGNAEIAIDFADFNDGNAVRGTVRDRRILDLNGNDITATVLAQMDAKFDEDDKVPNLTQLPVLSFRVGPGVTDAAGEIRGTLQSQVVNYNGNVPRVETYEEGNYYAILSGANADEIVGIIVITAEDPGFDNVTMRETGGFILYR
jgi:hypothetical protein